MADGKNNQIPAWQQAQAQAQAEPPPPPPPPAKASEPNDAGTSWAAEAAIEQARQFLSDETVRSSSLEKKTEFLKSKGFSDEQIQALLGEAEQRAAEKVESEPRAAPPPAPSPAPSRHEETPTASSTAAREVRADIPPIITYPEFLVASPKPPPLITPSRLLNILAASGSVWTLVYGTARYLVHPMVEDLNGARSEYHAHVGERLGELVERLEEVVSEVPYNKDKDGRLVLKGGGRGNRGYDEDDDDDDDDNESTISDPTELFHRDIGTQTSTPPASTSSSRSPSLEKEDPIDRQASRLSAIRSSLREIGDMQARRAESAADLGATLRSIRDEVDNLALPPPSYASYSSLYSPAPDYVSGGGGGGGGDDEFRRTKDAIRGVKGIFLSTRSFPTVAAW